MTLEMKNLTKNYGNYCALDRFSITLTDGIYGLLGANGAGKSTLMSLITDNVQRTSGEILCDGKEILKLGKSSDKRLDLCHSNRAITKICPHELLYFIWHHSKVLTKKKPKCRLTSF